ncbi:TIGR04500 family putative peptide maturation system protein [Planomonospora sp. ID67723]|uniref:TIGR04500 family putative peptide maturation system protein n=1 Tax=Planomonospora sp. ID67723 TaxID=2738134 RepID=UPI0018C38B8F|nr:TIGR04500 family putative peptide maturation system protein [Planomonospora sp. ID67723]MBG0826873.1 TIGR04500 family putative peptide maturation system protein [Planomonospora sp. ID67723]
MSLPSGRLLSDVLAHLHRLRDEEPDLARRMTAEFRREHPGVPMRLVWQRDSPAGPVHYDMLIPVEGGTVSLAFAPDRALPWPLRGAHHASEQVLLRVDGAEVTMEQAMALLEVLWTDTVPATRLVNASLVDRELESDPVELSPAELQEAVDAFRRARGLLTAEATRAWMAERGIDQARLEEVVAGEAAVARLRTRVVGPDVEAAFAADPGGWDALCVLRSRYADHEAARAAVVRRAGAHRGSAGQDDPGTERAQDGAGPGQGDADRGGTEANALAPMAAEVLEHGADVRVERVRRRDLGPAAAGARAGDLLGPLEHEPSIVEVLEVRPAELDQATRRDIESGLFTRWLADRRAEAELEWLWGTVPRTSALNQALRASAAGG